mgnify:CR=1 FL=1
MITNQIPKNFSWNIKNLKSTIVLFLCTASTIIHAEDKAKLAGRLVDAIGYERQIQNAQEKCIASSSSIKAEKRFLEAPELFGNITPESPLWPEIKKLFESYYMTACQYLNADRIKGLLVEEYANNLSEEELRNILTFYESNIGQRFAAASLSVSDKLNSHMSFGYIEELEAAEDAYIRDIKSIWERHAQRPAPAVIKANNSLP